MTNPSGHGGRRTGAGRKPLLGFFERIWIATEYERVTRKLAVTQRTDSFESTKAGAEITDLYRRIQATPVKDRQGRARKGLPIGEGDDTLDDLVGDVRSWIDEYGSRFLPAPPRLYRRRKEILQGVAAAATERFAVPVSARFVEGCVEEYRRLFPRKDAET